MMPLASEDSIKIIQRTRAAGAVALARVFARRGPIASERSMASDWLVEMRGNPRLLPEGWYQPPPGGISILIGQPGRYERLMYDSLRDPAVWPRDDIQFSPDSLIYTYASPTDRRTGLIGDIGATLYAGPSPPIREHLALCLQVSTQVACYAEVGMEFRDLFHYAQKLISDIGENLSNFVTSTTDSGTSNIGHTVPWSYEPHSPQAVRCLEEGDVTKIADMIRQKRIFLNASAQARIVPTMAFTVEPRIASPTLPLCSYHLIVTFINGKRHLCSGLEPVFKQFGMDRFLPEDTRALLDARE